MIPDAQALLSLAYTAIHQAAPAAFDVLELVHHLGVVTEQHGLDVADVALSLSPIARARGTSKRQLQEVLARYERGQTANFVVSLDPSNSRHPTEILDTGGLSLVSLGGMSSVRSTS